MVAVVARGSIAHAYAFSSALLLSRVLHGSDILHLSRGQDVHTFMIT